MTDLDALIAAVDAGGWPDRQTEVAAFYSGGSIAACNEHAGLARQANAGSLDAALRLHEALLPGWEWMMGNKGTATVIPPERLFAETGLVGPTCRVDGNPARAWLLSILRALKAQEDGK